MYVHKFLLKAGSALALAVSVPAFSQQPTVSAGFTYADIADMTLAAPVVAGAEIRRASKLKPAEAVGLKPGHARFYVQADVNLLIRGAQGLPARISYLVDVPLDAANRPPKLKKMRILLLANLVPGRPGELRLIAPDGQLSWTADNEARIRSILNAALSKDAPPRVTGVGKAFHVPGSLPGESETQIFLTTADSRPISLAILRRPGETPRWAVALGEMVDDSAGPPARDTLLWYRLACFLPPALPAASTAELGAAEAAAAGADYRLVMDGLGACKRSISR